MKKRFKVISAVMGLIMILGACGGGNGNSSSEKNKQQEGVVIKTNNRSPVYWIPHLRRELMILGR